MNWYLLALATAVSDPIFGDMLIGHLVLQLHFQFARIRSALSPTRP